MHIFTIITSVVSVEVNCIAVVIAQSLVDLKILLRCRPPRGKQNCNRKGLVMNATEIARFATVVGLVAYAVVVIFLVIQGVLASRSFKRRRLLGTMEAYRMLRAHRHWTICQSIYYAIWLTRG